MAAKRRAVALVQDDKKPVPKPVLAQSIVEIASGFKRLGASGLNRKAIIVLVSHSSKVGHGTVADVLDALDDLARDYTA